MDDAVALVVAAPVVALALWAVPLVGNLSDSQDRTAVAAEAAAHAAVHAAASDAAESAGSVALGATVNSCATTRTSLEHFDADLGTAAVAVACEVPGPIGQKVVCLIGYAQTKPAASGHLPAACPP